MQHFNELRNWNWWQRRTKGERILLVFIPLALMGLMARGLNLDYTPVAQRTIAAPVAAAAPTSEDIAREGVDRVVAAIRATTDRELVFENVVMQQYYPATGIYVAKWMISYTGSNGRASAYGVGSVHYNGGAINDSKNWAVTNAEIKYE